MPQPTDTTAQLNLHPLLHNAVHDVKMFGAKGDGSTNDTSAIQSAITAAGVLGGTVYIPPGTYITNAALTIPTGVDIRGGGMVNTVVRSTSATADIFASTSTTFISVRDLQVEKRITTSAGSAFNFTSVNNFILENIRVLAPYNGGTFTGCTPGYLRNIVAASAAGGNWHRGFFFQTCVSIHWDGCFINGGTTLLGGSQSWIQIDSGCDTFIAEHIEAGSPSGGGLCIWLTHTLSPSSFAPRWVRFHSFLVEGSNGTASFAGAQIGIRIDDALSAYFTDGYVASSAIGCTANAGSDLKFTNCEFLNNDQQGLFISGPDVVEVTDCTFSDNSQETNNLYAGLTIGSGSVGVRVCGGYFGDRLLGLTKKQKYGIETSASDTVIDGHQVFENLGTANVSGVPRGYVMAPAALATNATRGFAYIPTCAGTPTGVPTTQTGTMPMVYDTTNNFLYMYNGGAWKKTTVFA